ncbi:MAG: tetratricopeptide repeat protein [Candidatus Electrothrix sp. MAN1_4]|nr:tetratricopeptide repeat protein [Candidatus Electrothrix sp. MAN1_4]
MNQRYPQEKGGQGRRLHLINLESLGGKEQQAFFKGLNYHREHIARTCAGILAFWLPEPLVREMALQAADFWAWREQVLDFTVPVEPVERVIIDWAKTANMEAQNKQERIKEIDEFLTHFVGQPSLVTADLKRELGILYRSIGNYTESQEMLNAALAEYTKVDDIQSCALVKRDIAQLLVIHNDLEQALDILKKQVLPIFNQLNNERETAVTMGRIAYIFQRDSRFDEALKIREQEQLPVYERLGDLREQAVTIGEIADILKCCGKIDQAIHLYKKEVIPLFERIGAEREKAITMGRIAEILKARDELDEALKIYKKNELPIYERLGDVRSKAVTMGCIAGILQSRGELDKALDIRWNEELPVYERLGDVRSMLFSRIRIARLLHEIDAKANKERIEKLLRLALADARRLKRPGETAWIENIMKDMHIKPQ